jgi:RNA polymerase sigma factor (TIGR02999 family)
MFVRDLLPASAAVQIIAPLPARRREGENGDLPEDVSRWLLLLREGESAPEVRDEARRRLFELLYRELHEIAERLHRGRIRGSTLQTTVLIHEAFLRLIGSDGALPKDRGHFLALAATVMRRVLVDHVRARRTAKRGGDRARVALDGLAEAYEERAVDLERLDSALAGLAATEPRAASIVDLHFFAGLSLPQVAQSLDVSLRTVEREWQFARAWLKARLA